MATKQTNKPKRKYTKRVVTVKKKDIIESYDPMTTIYVYNYFKDKGVF
jgi:hypothetical protein